VALSATKSATSKALARKPACSTAIDDAAATAQQLVELNRAAGDSLRQNILQLVARESFAVLELARILDVAQTALSHHLKLLLAAGLLSRRPRRHQPVLPSGAAPQRPPAICRGAVLKY